MTLAPTRQVLSFRHMGAHLKGTVPSPEIHKEKTECLNNDVSSTLLLVSVIVSETDLETGALQCSSLVEVTS